MTDMFVKTVAYGTNVLLTHMDAKNVFTCGNSLVFINLILYCRAALD